ncbi:hypothetical protein [Haloarchaeobius sp. HME9146]|uniref:hypothetical protein n=1 Tax=Haloarchaeobius sp. HME9146 TaxID=2978732 RepID=UPI0021C0A29B|nr:hypothetical protein [Haloarchaeobius sp. HME9146]MCT9097720.1 hypothetical protein [Haloarchaeobius sp. HME9146]
MPTVRADSHRGRVCGALTTDDWKDCHDVARETEYSAESASSMLADVNRAGYVERKRVGENYGVEFEYRLKETVRVQ